MLKFSKNLLITISLGLGVVLFVGAMGIYRYTLYRYEDLDRIEVEENALRISNTLTQFNKVLESKVTDWARWNEAYEFVLTQNQDFIDANVTAQSFKGFKISGAAFLDADLNVIGVWALDNQQNLKKIATPPNFTLPHNPIIKQSKENQIRSGLGTLEGNPVFISAASVEDGSGNNVFQGRLVFFRYIDSSLIDELKFQILYPTSIESRFQDGSTKPISGKNVITFFHEEAIAEIPLISLEGDQVAIVKSVLPRRIAIFGRDAAGLIFVVLTGLMIACFVALYAFFRFSGVNKDFNELLYAHKDLAEKEAYQAALIASVPGYVSWFDKELNYEGVNERLAKDFGVPATEFIGKKAGFLDASMSPYIHDVLLAFSNSDQTSMQTESFLTAKESTKKFLLCLEKFSDSKIVCVGIDVSEAWRLEEQSLRDRQMAVQMARLSALGQMAGGVAHEINNPLAIIQAASRKIQRKLQKNEPVQDVYKAIDLIETTVQRITKIVNGLRTFSRDGSKDPLIQTNLSRVVDDTLALCREKLKNIGFEINVSEFDTSLNLFCREVEIGQVILNLINNAVDANELNPEKWIKLDVSSDDNFVTISVTDSGKGIPPEIAEKILNPFFTTKPVGKGTGLGLSISDGIIKAHGGMLCYDSTSVNTRFFFTLPVHHISQKVAG